VLRGILRRVERHDLPGAGQEAGADGPADGVRSRRRATLADIARLVGVSEATVSRALRDDPQISERTRGLAQQAARDLEYVPNVAARHLASRQSRTLGLLIPDVTDPMHAGVVSGFEAVASSHGYTVIVLNSQRDPIREARAIRELRAHQPAGVAFCGLSTDTGAASAQVRPGPAVFVGPEGLRGATLPTTTGHVLAAEAEGVRQLVNHLAETGRRRLSYLAGPPIASDRVRRDAITRTLEELELEPRLREFPEARDRQGYARIVELIVRERPEALVCYDDRSALNLMSALRERGVRVPDDVAITGFDDIPFARLANPQLTTVAQPIEEMGARAARMLLDAIGTGHVPDTVVFPVTLRVRESTALSGGA
jgi:LacI family transcriptional regulator